MNKSIEKIYGKDFVEEMCKSGYYERPEETRRDCEDGRFIDLGELYELVNEMKGSTRFAGEFYYTNEKGKALDNFLHDCCVLVDREINFDHYSLGNDIYRIVIDDEIEDIEFICNYPWINKYDLSFLF